jgi:hypothetical protein
MGRTINQRADEELNEAKKAIEKELIRADNMNPIQVFYPTIIDAIKELLSRRENETYWFLEKH